ncbi:hypothetical protein [Actinoplanes subtropicus]|uniref:hypothetical protein n=1 Tax=Actinoplanes subtropicus TaxID=543632 RepID=UPI0004C35CBC|nr:hypothetical protein [Actinoplanes subtropicus]
MRRATTLLAVAATCAAAFLSTPAYAAAGSYTGTLSDGASWVADVPANWNHTLILYSHGFGPLAAQDAPNADTRTELLAEGYAVVGSSYSGPSMWALATAVGDQVGALHAAERIVGQPRRTIAWGTSMGGLVSALEAQDARHFVDAALTTCGLVAGALNLNDYQLYGEYALAHLLAPGQDIQLVRYASGADGTAAAQALSTVVAGAQASAAGRARIALGAALLNEPGWYNSATAPAPDDYAGQEAQQQLEIGFVLPFIMGARQQVELAAGGNSSATKGVDFGAVLRSSAQAGEVRALYRAAGLDLNGDLRKLTRDADITADPAAIATLARTSTPTGRLGVPELDIHTIADQLVPVEQENWYGKLVQRRGDEQLLRQAYVNGAGHCAFQPAETIAALHAVEHRLDSGRWGDTSPRALNAATAAAGGTGRYVRYRAQRLAGGLGEPR